MCRVSFKAPFLRTSSFGDHSAEEERVESFVYCNLALCVCLLACVQGLVSFPLGAFGWSGI